MNVRDRLLERAAAGENIREEAARLVAAKTKAKREKSRRLAPRRKPGREAKALREAYDAGRYEEAKREAARRAMEVSNEHLGPRCEFVAIGSPGRCMSPAQDPDHVLGGAMRKECERLGAEGLMCLCRAHHDTKHANSPSRAYWIDVAEEHALRHGFCRLLPLIRKARAKYDAKHPATPGATHDR
jgi:hypothetical protein